MSLHSPNRFARPSIRECGVTRKIISVFSCNTRANLLELGGLRKLHRLLRSASPVHGWHLDTPGVHVQAGPLSPHMSFEEQGLPTGYGEICVSNLELFSHEKATHLNPIAGRPWSGGRACVPLSANLLRQHLLVLEHDWDYPLVSSNSDVLSPVLRWYRWEQCSSGRRYSRHPMPPAPVLYPFAPVVPAAAAGYMPYTYGYCTYASTSSVTPVAPVVPTAWGGYAPVAPQGAALPVSPYQFLSGYDPDAPISPATPGICAALLNALSLGDKILYLLTSTASSSPGIASDKGNLLQTAISIFGAQTGFSPVFQDVMVLAKIADKVFKQFQTASGRNAPAPNQQPGVALPRCSGSCGNRCDYHHHGDRPEQWSGEREFSSGCGWSRGCGRVPRLQVRVPPAAGALPPAAGAGVINNPSVVPKP